MDLSTVVQLVGQRDLGITIQNEALAIQNVFRMPPQSGISELCVLVIVRPGDLAENNVIEFLLEDANIMLDLLYFSTGCRLPADAISKYDLIFVAVSEYDRNHALLNEIDDLLAPWPKPVLNAPSRIAHLSRDGVSALLRSRPGMLMPITVRTSRNALKQICSSRLPIETVLPCGNFPVIVRPLDSHKGKGLERIDDIPQLAHYLTEHEGADYYLAQYVDYRSDDGMFRKYRIVLIDGKPFVCHVAISDQWMVHYMSAGMTQSEPKRAEEARFMTTFDDEFAIRHAAAFRTIATDLGLEYVGLDCGETRRGELLIFECDSSMTVHAMDPVDMFPYKQLQMGKVFSAFRELLLATRSAERATTTT